MPVFPQQFFTQDNVLVRTGQRGEREDYASRPLARKSIGPVKGIYTGLIPSALGSVLTLDPDPTEGLSAVRVPSRTDPAGMDVLLTDPVTVDFAAALPAELLPDGALVFVRASYTNGATTTGQVIVEQKTRTETVFTVGAAPATVDLSTLANLETVVPGSVSLAVNVDGFGADTITDDGAGNLTSVGPALPSGGTIDYTTGGLTGTTAALTALSMIFTTFSRCAGPNEVLVCRITGTPAAIVVNATPPDDRDTPIALTGCTIPYGFLGTGSIEALAAAVEILNEVTAARTDLQGVAHPDLKTRLDTDLAAPAMATRLGKVIRVLRSNTYQAPGGASFINVTGSFTENDRDHEPKITLSGNGSETTVGAIAGPVDTVRNVCVVIDLAQRDRLIENQSTRRVVIGRLNQIDDFLLDGQLTFTTALTTVTGDASAQFLTQIEVGDAVQGADGRFYEVASITSDSQLALANAYQGATASSGGLLRRRINLNFSIVDAGAETDEPLEATVSIEFFFPAFLDVSRGNFDNTVTMHKPGERPPVPDATTTVPGKVENAITGGLVGAIELQQGGAPVAGGPFHTLNFTAASIIENAPGELDVLSIGPIGPTGPGGGVGPTGDPGDPGPNIDQIADFERSGETSLSPATVTAVHTVNFGFDVDFLSGGIARFRDAGIFVAQDFIEITDIRLDTAQEATIEADGGSPDPIDSFVNLYLDAAGHLP